MENKMINVAFDTCKNSCKGVNCRDCPFYTNHEMTQPLMYTSEGEINETSCLQVYIRQTAWKLKYNSLGA